LILATAGAAIAWQLGRKHDPAADLRTAPVKRTDVVATISATGTVEPEEVVDIGAQVAGQISSFGKDQNNKPIDYGSVVEAGTVLAQIDDCLYAADVASAKAALQQAQANQLSAQANVEQMQAKLTQAEQDWNRAQKLGPSEALAPSAYDQYKSNFEVAKANLAVAKAGIEVAKANLAQALATLDRAQRNLGYCTITSPVKGVIIDRRVNIGQTVVSSLNAPSLFLLAKDLTRIQVWVSVNEADIGNIRPGMEATFTVDAFPNQVFRGQVGKVRLNATMTQNVVTYTVEVITDNSNGKLLPYLTANAQFITASHQNVLAVPNAALRWQPAGRTAAHQVQPKVQSSGSQAQAAAAGKPESPAKGQSAARRGQRDEDRHHGVVWVQRGDSLEPVEVKVGLTDGSQTEVESPELTEGAAVVLGEQSPQHAAGGSAPGASPFTPQLGRARSSANANPGAGRPGS
jgi:HlyD family secretion protein